MQFKRLINEKSRNLSFLEEEKIFELYKKADNLQTKYICNDDIGIESEFSDYIVNWLWHLIIINKKFIEERCENNAKC